MRNKGKSECMRGNQAATLFSTLLVFIAIFPLTTFHVTGQHSQQAAKLDQYLQAMMKKSNIPGFSIAVVTKDSVIFMKGYGVSSDGQPATEKTPYAIASLSKAFTALSVMQLVASQKIGLDAPAASYLPGLTLDDPRYSKMTVNHLLHQTSGFNDEVFPEMSFSQEPSSLNAAMARMQHVRLGDDPGKRYRYHNPNYQLLAKIIENVAQQPFPDYLKQHIFQPLGMENTTDVALTNLLRNTSHFQNGHIFAFGIPIQAREPDWFVEGAAGVVSNVADMSTWLRLQLNHGRWDGTVLLDSTHLRAMHTAPKTSRYGMGWFINEDKTISHNGILWTYSSEQMITANGYGIVMLFNSGFNPFEDYHTFIQGVADILNNKTPEIPIFPGWFFPLLAGCLIVLAIVVAVRRLLRVNQWRKNIMYRPKWRTVLLMFARTIPIILFLSIPLLFTALSGRVLNWKRIFLVAPDLVTGLAIIALLHAMILASRMYFLMKFRK